MTAKKAKKRTPTAPTEPRRSMGSPFRRTVDGRILPLREWPGGGKRFGGIIPGEDPRMHAHKLKIVILEDHQLHVQGPEEVPAGPAMLLVLGEPPQVEEPEEPSTDEASRRFVALAERLAADPRPFDELSDEERSARLRQIMGIGRGLFSSSEEFARRKQEEIELEERRFGR